VGPGDGPIGTLRGGPTAFDEGADDADHLRRAIAAKGSLAVTPNNPSRAVKYPLDKHL